MRLEDNPFRVCRWDKKAGFCESGESGITDYRLSAGGNNIAG
jgi:alpha-D-ribose 1-methylphosphonate 5-phosphate C-P lyase